MGAGEMEQFARIGAIVAGILFGGWALSSVIWVWTKKQIYAYGGSALSVVGIILMGLSIYKTVDVKAAPDGIGIKLSELEGLLKEQKQAQQVTQQKLAEIPAEFGLKVAALDKSVKEQSQAQLERQTKIITDLQNRITTLDASLKVFDQKGPVQRAVGQADKKNNLFPYVGGGGPEARQIRSLEKQIQDEHKKARPDYQEISGWYMDLGDSYKDQGQLSEALVAYENGVKALSEYAKQVKAQEPDKK